jgi:hypothetical protein
MGKVKIEYVITLYSDAYVKHPAVFLNTGMHEHWLFDVPAKFDEEQRLTFTRRVRDQIEDRLRLWLTQQSISPKEYR